MSDAPEDTGLGLEERLMFEAKIKKLEAENATLKAGVTVFKDTIEYVKPRKNGLIRNRGCLVGSKQEKKLINAGWKPKHDPIARGKAMAAKKAAAEKAKAAEDKRIADAKAEAAKKAAKKAAK